MNDRPYNHLVVAPTLYLEDRTGFAVWMNADYRRKQRQHDAVVGHLEAYAREMVANCALTISIPSFIPLVSPRELKGTLSPSLRRRISIVDRRNSTWEAVRKYFAPLTLELNKHSGPTGVHGRPDWAESLEQLEWGIYNLVIAARQGGEVLLSPHSLQASLSLVREEIISNREGAARLAVIEGILRSFGKNLEIPGLRVYSTNPNSLMIERLEELVEDAYLLEASRLRRFFSLSSNLSSIRRDLRKITRDIERLRPWAKGLVKAGSMISSVGNAEAASELLEVVTGHSENCSAPLCLDPQVQYRSLLRKKQSSLLVFGKGGDGATMQEWTRDGRGAFLWSTGEAGFGFKGSRLE